MNTFNTNLSLKKLVRITRKKVFFFIFLFGFGFAVYHSLNSWIFVSICPNANYLETKDLVESPERSGRRTPDNGWEFTLSTKDEASILKLPFFNALKTVVYRLNLPYEKSYYDRFNYPFLSKSTFTQDKLSTSPGGTLHINGKILLSKRAMKIAKKNNWKIQLSYVADRVFTETGRYVCPIGFGMSSSLTVSGFPIETQAYGQMSSLIGAPYSSPIEGLVDLSNSASPYPASREYEVDVTIPIPKDCPQGKFRLSFDVGAFKNSHWMRIDVWEKYQKTLDGWVVSAPDLFRAERTMHHGPVFDIGTPAQARMIWTLMNLVRSSGTRGTVALEDRSSFALNLTGIHQNEMIVPPFRRDGQPIQYDLSPYFPTQNYRLSQAVPRNDMHYPPIPLKSNSGEWQLKITGPDGKTTRSETGGFEAIGDYRASSSRLLTTFQYGKNVVSLKGWVEDVYGNRLDGGGEYIIYGALPLSFSSSSKPGQTYGVGMKINPRIHIFPPGETHIRFSTTNFRNSKKDDVQKWVHEGTSNKFGYYYPKGDTGIPAFDAPGEYQTNMEVWRWEENGVFRYHHINQGGIVYDPATVLDLEGIQLRTQQKDKDKNNTKSSSFITMSGLLPIGPREQAMTFVQPPVQKTMFTLVPDVSPWGMIYAGTLVKWADSDITAMSPGPWKTEKSDVYQNLLGGQYGRSDRPLPIDAFDNYFYKDNFFNSDFPFPMVATTRSGYNPAMYPEHLNVSSHCYSSVIRPGLPLRRQVFDATNIEAAWYLTPDASEYQQNSRSNGDVVNDHYRVLVSCMRKEKDRAFYGYFPYTVGLSPGVSNINGNFESGEATLIQMDGKKIQRIFGNSPEAGTLFERNDAIPVGGFVLPTTENLPISMRLDFPDGHQETRETISNRFGEFGMKPFSAASTPGFLWATIQSHGNDQIDTQVLGLPGNRSLMFVASNNHQKLSINLSAGQHIAPGDRITILGKAPEEAVEGKIGYVRVTPGMVLDQNILQIADDGSWGISFTMSQDTVRSGFFRPGPLVASEDYGYVPSNRGNLQIGIFFFIGKDKKGRPITAHATYMTNGMEIFAVDSAPNPASGFSQYPVYDWKPSIPVVFDNFNELTPAEKCGKCHDASEIEQWQKNPFEFSTWVEALNWHRAKSPKMFWWDPLKDKEKLTASILMREVPDPLEKADRQLIKDNCLRCHLLTSPNPWLTESRYTRQLTCVQPWINSTQYLRYTSDGWKRYVDHRFPAGLDKPIDGQRFGFMRDLIPDFCIRCHSTAIMQANPKIDPLPPNERKQLIAALSRRFNGQAALPSCEGQPDCEGKSTYVQVCFSCHSLELKKVPKNKKLAEFIQGHLVDKAPERITDQEMDTLIQYFSKSN